MKRLAWVNTALASETPTEDSLKLAPTALQSSANDYSLQMEGVSVLKLNPKLNRGLS